MSKKITSTTALVDCLVDNNRFASRKITAEHIGAENFREWKNLLANLHKVAYNVYANCEDSDLTANNTSLDLTAVFDALRAILAEFGEINGHAVYANAELATLIIGYSGKRGNVDSPALQLCLSKLSNRMRELAKIEGVNGINPDKIAALKDEIDELKDEKADLLANPDNRIKQPTRATFEAFRLEVEHKLARVISDQKAKSWADLEAELEAKRKERRAKTKAKKAAKKSAEANA